MSRCEYDLWTLEDLHPNNPRDFLDFIIINASVRRIQAMQYKNFKVFIISEEQYNKLKMIEDAQEEACSKK